MSKSLGIETAYVNAEYYPSLNNANGILTELYSLYYTSCEGAEYAL